MPFKTTTPIGAIIAKSPRLNELLETADQLTQLTRRIGAKLPAELARCVRVASFRDGVLVIVAASPAWAARMRYASPELLAALNNEPATAGVNSIEVRVSSNPDTITNDRFT